MHFSHIHLTVCVAFDQSDSTPYTQISMHIYYELLSFLCARQLLNMCVERHATITIILLGSCLYPPHHRPTSHMNVAHVPPFYNSKYDLSKWFQCSRSLARLLRYYYLLRLLHTAHSLYSLRQPLTTVTTVLLRPLFSQRYFLYAFYICHAPYNVHSAHLIVIATVSAPAYRNSAFSFFTHFADCVYTHALHSHPASPTSCKFVQHRKQT